MSEKRYEACRAAHPARHQAPVVHFAKVGSNYALCGKLRTGWKKAALRREDLCLRCHAAYQKQHEARRQHGGTGLPGEALGGD